MPIYQCYSPAGLLSGPQKRRIAQEITAIHTKQISVPELFVNALFHQIADGDCFVAGKATSPDGHGAMRHPSVNDWPPADARPARCAARWSAADSEGGRRCVW